MVKDDINDLVSDYLNNGGKIKKFKMGRNDNDLIEGDTNDMCYHKREYLPPSFLSPSNILKEDVKALV